MKIGAQSRDRTGTPSREQVFETCASAYSATWAGGTHGILARGPLRSKARVPRVGYNPDISRTSHGQAPASRWTSEELAAIYRDAARLSLEIQARFRLMDERFSRILDIVQGEYKRKCTAEEDVSHRLARLEQWVRKLEPPDPPAACKMPASG